MAAKKSSNLTYANNAFVSGHITAFMLKIILKQLFSKDV